MSHWRVRFWYAEPTYDLRRGRDPVTRSGSYDLEASSMFDAIAKGRARFKREARDSHVGWVRELRLVTAEVLEADR